VFSSCNKDREEESALNSSTHHSGVYFHPMSNQNRPTPQPEDRDDEMKQRITEERLFQASISFKLASISATAFASVSLIGAGLLLSGYLSAGTLTAASGAVPTVYCIKLAKDANDRLDRIFEELND
jgi:hypothetical protein